MNLCDEKGYLKPMKEFEKASDESMKWWREARFGMFVHWGPAALGGGDISWCRDSGYRPGDHNIVAGPHIPARVYDSFYKEFDPVDFDARKWVQTIKAAGMSYVVLTAKHHDGFCLFDSRFTEYKSTAWDCPCQKDIVKELADACHESGVKFGLYYSARDWHHADYLKGDNSSYLQYYTSQLVELLTNYGRVDLLWFDHIGGPHRLWNPDMVLRLARTLHPGILINDRLHASVHDGRIPEYACDFDTPEQVIGKFNDVRPWESCMCLVGGVWSYKPDGAMMSFGQCVNALASCAGGDGNLLLNTGPMPDGNIEERQKERLLEIGRWLGKYGESIYKTRGGPIMPTKDYACTSRGSILYLHIFDISQSYIFPGIAGNLESCSVLNGSAEAVLENNNLRISKIRGDECDTIIKITLG
jgi:alpha-L-fucosidase